MPRYSYPCSHGRERVAKKRGNGEGSVYRRKDGLWVGQYKVLTPQGTKKTKYTCITAPQSALDKYLSERTLRA